MQYHYLMRLFNGALLVWFLFCRIDMFTVTGDKKNTFEVPVVSEIEYAINSFTCGGDATLCLGKGERTSLLTKKRAQLAQHPLAKHYEPARVSCPLEMKILATIQGLSTCLPWSACLARSACLSLLAS